MKRKKHLPTIIVALSGIAASVTYAQPVKVGLRYTELPQSQIANLTQVIPYYGSNIVTAYHIQSNVHTLGNTSAGPATFPWPAIPVTEASRIMTGDDHMDAVPVYAKNDSYCTTYDDSGSFTARTTTSVSVTDTRGTNVQLSAALDAGQGLLGSITSLAGIDLSAQWTSSQSTSYSYQDRETISSQKDWQYPLDPCQGRLVSLKVTEKTKTVKTDKFSQLGAVYGPVFRWNPQTQAMDFEPNFPTEVIIGWGFESINATATWAITYEVHAGPKELIEDCFVSDCNGGGGGGGGGGTSDGDIDNDGIPDWDDPDMDGDGISNEYDDDMDGDGTNNNIDWDNDNDGIHNDHDDTPHGPDGGDDYDDDDISNGDDFDINGDHIPNWAQTGDEEDLDGDGVLNKDDGDIDGDGIPNNEDDTPYGTVPTFTVWDREGWREVPIF